MPVITTNPVTSVLQNINTTQKKCRLNKGVLPSFTPIINNLSMNYSSSGQYALVYVSGSNFFNNGTTYINFGTITKIPIVFYNSFTISFVVPLNASPGIYKVSVVNMYSGNFSPQINNSYSSNLNYSNSVIYTLT
jgi:hypothetical protein